MFAKKRSEGVARRTLRANFRAVRYLWLSLALVFLTLSLLTVFKAPTLLGWKLALLADEFGYGLILFAVALALSQVRGGWQSSSPSVMARVTCFASGLAAALLAGPPLRAWKISRRLPQRFEAAFHTKVPAENQNYFRWADFLRIHAGPTQAFRTYVYSQPAGEDLHLDFYPAHHGAASPLPSPCIVVVHGGGWNNGDRTQLAPLNSWLAERGYAVAALDYRLVPKSKWPAPREDTEAALAWLQAHASELNIDPKQLVLLGRSAGGQIALATAYGATKHVWRGVISLYGPADMAFAYQFGEEDDVLHSLALLRNFLGGTPQQEPAQYKDASPYLYVQSDDPPTLLIHGKLDTLVWHKQSERLDLQLAKTGVPHLFVSLPWATHAFDINLNGPSGQLTRNTIEAYLKIVLGGS